MYRAIIFDFFDVIRTDDYKSWLSRHGYRLEGPFLDAVKRQDRGDIDLPQFLQILSQLSGQSPKEIFTEMEEGTAIDYEVLALIEQLKPQYQIGLLSNAPSAFLRGLLHNHDLDKYFDHIAISSEMGHIKPDTEAFQYTLSAMNIQPEETVFIDDNPRNVAGAETVGIRGIVYTDIRQLRKELADAGITY
jgi:putative hydrolase of the HAD superfamily